MSRVRSYPQITRIYADFLRAKEKGLGHFGISLPGGDCFGVGRRGKVRDGGTPSPTRGTRVLPGEESNAARWRECCLAGRVVREIRAVSSFRRAAEKSTRAGCATRNVAATSKVFLAICLLLNCWDGVGEI